MRKNLIASIILIFSLLPLYAESIEVSGEVSGVWDVDTVFVINYINVPADSTLIINAGAIVEFQGDYTLSVQGSLIAIGSEQDSILFIVGDTTGFGDNSATDGGWGGISSSSQLEASIFLSHCIFSFFT